MLVNLVSGRFCHDVRRVRLGHSASRDEVIAKEVKTRLIGFKSYLALHQLQAIHLPHVW